MSNAEKLKNRALGIAREQFEYCDFTDYSPGEIADEVADMMVEFALQELERKP